MKPYSLCSSIMGFCRKEGIVDGKILVHNIINSCCCFMDFMQFAEEIYISHITGI